MSIYIRRRTRRAAPRAFHGRRRRVSRSRFLPARVITALLGLYLVGLGFHGDSFSMFVDGWLGILTQSVPAAFCLGAARRAGRRRLDVVLAASAVTAFAVGNTYFVVAAAAGVTLPYPSPADLGYLLFYPFMLGALATTVARTVHARMSSLWLDSALGALGAGSVLAVLMNPLLQTALAGGCRWPL
jgi:diguanylate cyclase